MIFKDTGDEHDVVNFWLRTLGDRVRLAIKLDDNGLCAIGNLSGIDCALEVPQDCGKIYLRAPLLALDQCSEAVLRFCLSRHFMGIQSAGAIFAIDEKDSAMVLWMARDLTSLDLESFALMLVDFFEAAEHWKYELENLLNGTSEALQESAEGALQSHPFALRA